MVTPTLVNIRGREAFLIMGGPVASLAVGAIATTAALGAKGQAWEPYWAFLSMCAAMGWASFVTNLIPLKSAARYSDGAQLHQLVSGGEWAHFHIAFAMVASSLATPIRARDFNVSTINRAADFITQGERGLLLRLFACIHYLDVGRVPEALSSMQAAEGLYEQSTFEKPEYLRRVRVHQCVSQARSGSGRVVVATDRVPGQDRSRCRLLAGARGSALAV